MASLTMAARLLNYAFTNLKSILQSQMTRTTFGQYITFLRSNTVTDLSQHLELATQHAP